MRRFLIVLTCLTGVVGLSACAPGQAGRVDLGAGPFRVGVGGAGAIPVAGGPAYGPGRPMMQGGPAPYGAPGGPDTSDPLLARMAALGRPEGLKFDVATNPEATARCRGDIVLDNDNAVPLQGGKVYFPYKCLQNGR